MDYKQTLEEASDMVLKHRASEYGENSFAPLHIRIASVWSGILNREVTATEVALCMTVLKLVRAAQVPDKLDSYLDGIGYLGIASHISEAQHPEPEYGTPTPGQQADLARMRRLLTGNNVPGDGAAE